MTYNIPATDKLNANYIIFLGGIKINGVIYWSSHYTLIIWPDPLQLLQVDVNGGIVT